VMAFTLTGLATDHYCHQGSHVPRHSFSLRPVPRATRFIRSVVSGSVAAPELRSWPQIKSDAGTAVLEGYHLRPGYQPGTYFMAFISALRQAIG
jgi:hypothetical protein